MCKMLINRHTKQKYLSMPHHEPWVNLSSFNSTDEMDMILCSEMDMIMCSEMYMLLSK